MLLGLLLGLLTQRKRKKKEKKAESGEKKWPSLTILDPFPFREQQDEKKPKRKKSVRTNIPHSPKL